MISQAWVGEAWACKLVLSWKTSRFCCQNPSYITHGNRGKSNFSVCGHIDRAKTIRQLYCNVRKARFAERRGTVFYRARLTKQKVLAILQHVQDGSRGAFRLCLSSIIWGSDIAHNSFLG
jgi:hypothetical protein